MKGLLTSSKWFLTAVNSVFLVLSVVYVFVGLKMNDEKLEQAKAAAAVAANSLLNATLTDIGGTTSSPDLWQSSWVKSRTAIIVVGIIFGSIFAFGVVAVQIGNKKALTVYNTAFFIALVIMMLSFQNYLLFRDTYMSLMCLMIITFSISVGYIRGMTIRENRKNEKMIRDFYYYY